MKNKVITILTISVLVISLLTISLVISISYNIKNHNESDRKKHVIFNFTLTYIYDIKEDIKGLENCHSTGNYKNFSAINGYLVNSLYSLDQLLSDAFYLVSIKDYGIIGTEHDFQQVANAFEGRLEGMGYQGSFTEDGILSDNELKFVHELSKDLEAFTTAIVGKDKINVNPKLTVKEFTNALQEFSDKLNFYHRYSEFSPFDYLKRK